MKELEKNIKIRYSLLVLTFVVLIISGLVIVQSKLNSQISEAHLINLSGNQRVLSQNIVKQVLAIGCAEDLPIKDSSINTLKSLLNQWEEAHNYLLSINKQNENNSVIDSLLLVNTWYQKAISTSGKNIVKNYGFAVLDEDINAISEAEIEYALNTDFLINEYQKKSTKHLQKLRNTIYILVFIAVLIFFLEFLFILLPTHKQLFLRGKELLKLNSDLAISESDLKAHLVKFKKLKTDLELKERLNKAFIDQTPTAIAMLDTDMCYMAVSKRWLKDYNLEGQDIIGCSHYDIFPEIGVDWKEKHKRCLAGASETSKEAPFVRKDGTVQWIYWDVRPWYISEGNIGGLIIHTRDITHIKEKEDAKKRNDKILEKTNEVARIGTWDIDLLKNKLFWSKVVLEIHEVPEGFMPDLETAINFYKEGESRDIIRELIKEAIDHGTPFDVEVELVTFKGNTVWTRAIGQVEKVDGKPIRIYGVFQDINKIKMSQIALNNAHRELKAIFNSGVIAIVSTDADGIITHFNRGAEILTGYSASEIIGLRRPKFYHLQEELDTFRFDVAKRYDKDPVGLNASLELSKHNGYDTREWTYLRKDGSTIPVQLTLTSIKNKKGELMGYLGVSTDISDKKNVQDELLRKNQLLNFAEEITLMGNWTWDTVNDKVEWSSNLYNIFGLDKSIDSLNFNTYFNFVHLDDRDSVTNYFDKVGKDKSLKRFTHRILAGDGTLKYIQLLGEVITNDSGYVVEMIGTCQDVTEQRITEDELIRKNKILNFAEKISSMGNWQVDIANEFVKWSKNMYSIFELDENTFTTLDTYVNFSHPEDKDRVAQHMRETFEIKVFNELIHRIKLADGTIKIVKLLGEVITNSLGEVTEVIGSCQDVTAQKQAEIELLRKNHFLSCAERITKMGNWQWNVVTDTLIWSTNLYKIYEYDETLTNLTYDTFFSQVHPEDKDYITDYVKGSFVEKKFPDNFIHRIITSSGKIKTVHYLGEVILNDQGEVIEMMGTCQDITEQKMEEKKFRGLLESAPDAMVITNEDSKIQLINKQAEKLFGYKIEEIFNKSVDLLLPKRYLENHEYQRQSFFKTPKSISFSEKKELFAITKGGKEFPIQLGLSPLKTEEGILVSAVIRDITEQKEAQNKIVSAKNDLEILAKKLIKNNNQLADFAHITSHNLRAPVSNLNSLLGLYNTSTNEADKILFFEKFEKVIIHLTSTLNTLVDAIRIKNNTSNKLEKVSFSKVLNITEEILTGEILKSGAIITSDFSEISKIKYDRIYLESIFLNLVGNSIKYRAKDRVPEIFIQSKLIDGKIRLTFKDNGLGIDLERHGSKLFGLNKVFHRHPEAKGVGLFMVKTQVEALNGTIYAESEVNKGTTFNINFNEVNYEE